MKTDRLDMRADPAFVARIDQWRRVQADIPTRAEAVRRLVELALAGKTDRHVSDMKGDMPANKPAVEKPKPAKVEKPVRAAAVQPVRPWRKLRPVARKALAGNPGWPAYRDQHGLKIDQMSRRTDFEAVCKALRIDLDGL